MGARSKKGGLRLFLALIKSVNFGHLIFNFLCFLSLYLYKCLDYLREIGNTILNRAKNLADNSLAVSFQAGGYQQFGNSDK